MRFEKSKSTTRVQKEIEKSSEEDTSESVYEGDGLEVISDRKGEVIVSKKDGSLSFRNDVHSWYIHFTPYGQTENTPEIKSAILLRLYEELKDLTSKVDTGSIDEPELIQGSTNPEMADLVESFGFDQVDPIDEQLNLGELSENDIERSLETGEEKDFFDSFVRLARSFAEDDSVTEEDALNDFLNLWNSLETDSQLSVSRFMTLLARNDDSRGGLIRSWIDSKIDDLQEAKQYRVRETITQAADIVGKTNTKRVVGNFNAVRRALGEFEQRELSSGESFIGNLRSRAENNPPTEMNDWPM
jgi:hypothetical protein